MESTQTQTVITIEPPMEERLLTIIAEQTKASENSAIIEAKALGLPIDDEKYAEATAKIAEEAGVEPDISEKAWVAGEYVVVDVVRTYNSKKYDCIQPHVTQSDWPPDKTPALWKVHEEPGEENWKIGVAYAMGDKRRYPDGGQWYECIQPHTSQAGWTPDKTPALWKKV